MANAAYAPTAEVTESSSVGPTVAPVYLVDMVSCFEVSSTGPGDAFWVTNSGAYDIDTTGSRHDAAFFKLGDIAQVR